MIRTALLCAILLPAAASAQVSVNSGALDQLKPAPATAAAAASPAKPAPPHRAARPAPPAKPPARGKAPAASTSKPKPRPVVIAPAPPPAPVLTPLVEAPRPPTAPPPPPIPMLPDAEGEATALPTGLRVTFGAGKAELNPRTEAALRKLAQTMKADPAVDLSVFAYAAGVPDDPSTPRRLSLSRALAARAVLISEGIASTRIYPRALGATPSDGPADRVDVVRAGLAPAPEAKPAEPKPAEGKP